MGIFLIALLIAAALLLLFYFGNCDSTPYKPWEYLAALAMIVWFVSHPRRARRITRDIQEVGEHFSQLVRALQGEPEGKHD